MSQKWIGVAACPGQESSLRLHRIVLPQCDDLTTNRQGPKPQRAQTFTSYTSLIDLDMTVPVFSVLEYSVYSAHLKYRRNEHTFLSEYHNPWQCIRTAIFHKKSLSSSFAT